MKVILLSLLVLGTDAFVPSRLSSVEQGATVRRSALKSVPNALDVLTSGLASIARLNKGVVVDDRVNAETKSKVTLNELYDVENNAACRRVRERITELDLPVETVIPCAKASKARQGLGPDVVLPRLVAETDGEEVVVEGADEIIAFLNKQTGSDSLPADELWQESLMQLVDMVGGAVATLLRFGRGQRVSPAIGARPEKPVILYDYAGNQFCRFVREVLTGKSQLSCFFSFTSSSLFVSLFKRSLTLESLCRAGYSIFVAFYGQGLSSSARVAPIDWKLYPVSLYSGSKHRYPDGRKRRHC